MKKLIYELRVFNRYVLATCVTLFIVLIFSWFYISGFINIFFMNYDEPDLLAVKNVWLAKLAFLKQIMYWEVLVDSSMFYLINFFALFFVMPTLGLIKEKKSYFVFGCHRFKSFNKTIMTTILSYSLVSGICTVFAFLFFYAIGGMFVTNQLENIGGITSAFSENFYSNNPYLVFLFIVCTIYFSLAFVFALLACGLMLWIENEYYVLVIMISFYFLYGYIGGYFDNSWFTIFASIVAFNTTKDTFEVFLPIFPLFLLAVSLIFIGIRKYRNKIF